VFTDAYAVIDLAALSNDPAGELEPERTFDINFRARVRTASLAKEQGVQRYILASSCSVYGFQDDIVDEAATPAPITTYAESSLRAEGGVLALEDDSFCVTILRQGTLYGLSPRMRFDLVVNAMTRSLHTDRIITVRGGDQWRPLLHVGDSARAFIQILEAPAETVSGETFNVGATDHNFTVAEVARHVHAAGGGEGDIVHDKTALDTRSYRVSSDKIRDVLGFAPRSTPHDAAIEILQALRDGTVTDSPKTNTIHWYKHLLLEDPEILDREFR
jgi:nucleoside-diphosphate-sugar epimerase